MATNIAALKSDAQAAPRKQKTIFDLLMDDKAKTAIGAVAGKYMTPDRFLRLAINCIKKTPRLMECDPKSVLGSFMASAALGLEPNTVLQQAFLIPYAVRGKLDGGAWGTVGYDCQFQIGYRGFITLAHRSPHILTLDAEAIHAGDHFKHRKGSEFFLEYEKALINRGELIGAYAFSKLADGGEAATILPLEELHKIRGRSETYMSLLRKAEEDPKGNEAWKKQKAEEKLAGTPWVMWEDDMGAKSAVKKHSKQLPMSPGDEMAAAVSLDADRDDGKTIDMADLADPDRMREVMQDGDVPEAGDAPAALPNDATESAEFGGMQKQAEKVDVAHFNATQRSAAKTQATDVEPTAKATDKESLDAEAIVASIAATKDLDHLDLLADKIRTMPAKDQPRLNKLYRARRTELTGGGEVQQASFTME